VVLAMLLLWLAHVGGSACFLVSCCCC
jgi:hypothetical protein